MRLLAFVLAAVVLVPAASATVWAPLSPATVSNHADPAVLRVKGGILVAYDVGSTGSVTVVDASGGTHTVATGYAAVSDPQLVQKPDGTIYLYVGASTTDLKTSGVLRFTSTNGGVAWSGPLTTNPASRLDDVQASALRPDGTPLFTQDGTGFVNVYQGDNGDTLANDFTPCCGYDESVAVESSGQAQLAFWSNASGKAGYLYELLDANGAAAGAPVNVAAGTDAQAQPSINRVPLAADGAGNTFMAWPGNRHVNVAAFGAGKLRRKFSIRTAAAPSQLALAVEPDGGKLWVVWTARNTIYATRLRDAAHAAEPVVVHSSRLPGTTYALEAVGLAGRVEPVVNVGLAGGNQLVTANLLPGLAAHVTSARRPFVTVRDDDAAVQGATLRGGGKTVQTNAKGRASLKAFRHHTRVQVTKPGYVGASFVVP